MRPLAGRALAGALLSAAGLVAAPGLAAAAPGGPAVAVKHTLPLRLPHGLGARRPSTRLAAPRPAAARVRSAALPASVDLSAGAPAIGDQGQVGSCGPWAVGYSIMGYYAKTQPHAGAPFAAMSLYNEVNGGRDVGTSVFQLYDALKQKGITEQAVWKHGLNDVTSRPSSAEAANALTHRSSGGTVLFLGDRQGSAARTAIETALAAGHPVAIGMPVFDGFFRLSGGSAVMTASKATGTNYGGHEVAAYGYNDSGVKIANSWGKGWGTAGWATLSWDFVDRYVFEASTPNGFTTSTPTAPAATPPVISVGAGTRVPAATGGTVVVTGSGFGTTAADVAAGRLTATVNGTRTALAWTCDTAVVVTVPPGAPGGTASITLARQGAASAPVTVTYAASIGGLSVTHGPSTGGTVTTVSGRGFAGASTWALMSADGSVFAALPVVASLDGVPAGVVLLGDTSARVKLPASPKPFLPVVVTFTPDPRSTRRPSSHRPPRPSTPTPTWVSRSRPRPAAAALTSSPAQILRGSGEVDVANGVTVVVGIVGLVAGWLVSGYQRVGEKLTEERRAAYGTLLAAADTARRPAAMSPDGDPANPPWWPRRPRPNW